ncbi:MAG TPA: PBSX family phage terminase large subunit [Thiopseudomonas sp.]|nr:PBSX family phage terminase large subunit [Thiopseudomonas sp.]
MFQLNPNLKDFWRTRKPYKLLKGGRFSSKTQDAGGMAAFLARNYSLRFLCIRQFQNRIGDSVYTVVKEKIEAAGWEAEFDIGVSTIKHKVTGSEFLFYGIARNLNDIKGTEGIDICWIEEGEGLTEQQWAVIDPTIRKEGAEVWLLWNPHLKTDFVQAKLPSLLGDDCIIKHINYPDNPFLSDTAKQKAERLRLADPEAYEHVYLGQPISDDDAAIIKYSWIEAAIDAHIKLELNLHGAISVGYDVADSGADKNATAVFNGAICQSIDEWSAGEDELVESAYRAWAKMPATGGAFIYDAIGVGAHTGSTLSSRDQKSRVFKFLASGAVIDPKKKYSEDITNGEKFENLKAQAWVDVADRFRNTYNAVTKGHEFAPDELISISSEIAKVEQLKIELSTPRKKTSKRGLDMVETKDQLKARDVDSPNLADAFIMGACPHLIELKPVAKMRRLRGLG